jgi:autotransporter-associated beta strand protein
VLVLARSGQRIVQRQPQRRGSFSATGTGTWTLSGSNTYTGSTSVTSGQLTLAHGAALGATSALTVNSGATLGLQGGIAIPRGKDIHAQRHWRGWAGRAAQWSAEQHLDQLADAERIRRDHRRNRRAAHAAGTTWRRIAHQVRRGDAGSQRCEHLRDIDKRHRRHAATGQWKSRQRERQCFFPARL